MKQRRCTTIIIALWAVLGFAAVTLSACNTVEGVGKDVEAIGEGTQELSRDARD